MAYAPRQYPLVDIPRGPDPLQSLAGLMSIANSLEDRKVAREENMYQRRERARVDENRQTLQSAQSSPLPPEEIKKQLAQLGRGDLVPVYEEARTGLEANRLKLKAAKDASALADKDYWGHLGYVVTKANGDPLAIDYALREAEQDGHDVTQAREALKANPDAWKPLAEQLIANSPAQQERIAKEQDRALSQTREDRALQTQKDLAADRAEDNRRADRAAAATAEAAKATADYRNKMLERSGRDLDRITPQMRATAARSMSDDLDRLEKEFRVSRAVNDPALTEGLSAAERAMLAVLSGGGKQVTPMTEGELNRRKLNIYNAYLTGIGQPTVAALPADWKGGQRSASPADVDQVAKRLGITTAEAKQQLEASGVTLTR